MDFEIVNSLDFLPHLRVENGSSPTWFTHLMASPRITATEWESNPVLRPLLMPRWGKEFTFANYISAKGQLSMWFAAWYA
jgi:hypothetical protein